MKKCYLLIFLFCCGWFLPHAFAQRKNRHTQETTEIRVISEEEPEDLEIIQIFKENAPKAFTAPGAPRFAILGKEKKFYLGIGGYVKGTASFDFKNPIDNPTYFTTSNIPMNQAPGNGGLFQLSAQTSNIFFNFIAMPGQHHQLGAYINFNFANDGYAPDLQYAYLTYRGFSIGYNFSMFADLNAGPPTIDQEGPPSWPTVSNPQLNYTYKHGGWSFAVGAELPMTSETTNSYTSQVNQRIPAIPAYIQYAWGKNSNTVRLAGLWRNMQYRNLVEEKNHNAMGWGIQLTGTLSPVSQIEFFYQGLYGKGISSFMQDMNGLGLDLVPNPTQEGKLNLVESWGGYLGMQINLTKNVFCSHTYSQVRNYADSYQQGTTLWKEQYRYAQYIVNNVFWNCTSNIQVGLEYIWGRKVIMDGEKRSDNRIQAMMQFNF